MQIGLKSLADNYLRFYRNYTEKACAIYKFSVVSWSKKSIRSGKCPVSFPLYYTFWGDRFLDAYGQLVENNFWNGKPMLVRVSDLIGKKVELKILPLGKSYPIYLQQEQKAILDNAAGNQLLSLDSIKVIQRKDNY